MTTAQQRRFYFPAWNKACKTHGWKSSLKGDALLATRRESWGSPEVDKIYRKVWFVALGLMDKSDRTELEFDDLRQACNMLVAPDRENSGSLNNTETNRVVALFDLLADDTDLDAMLAWENPERAERLGYISAIKKRAPFAYYTKICKDKFGTGDLEDLNERQLRQLLSTVTARVSKKRKAVAA